MWGECLSPLQEKVKTRRLIDLSLGLSFFGPSWVNFTFCVNIPSEDVSIIGNKVGTRESDQSGYRHYTYRGYSLSSRGADEHTTKTKTSKVG